MLVRDRDRRVTCERRDARDHLVEHDPERVHVAAAVDRQALRLLGREVGGGAHHRTGLREPVARARARDAEVGDLHGARLREQHVARLHVAVHDAAAMRERERGRDLGGDLGRLVRVDRRFGPDQVAQRSALDVLHDDEVRARLLAPVVDRNDVRVVEVRGGLRFPPEPLDERRFARVLGEERLQARPAGSAVGRARDTPRPSRPARARAGSRSGSKRPVRPASSLRKPYPPFAEFDRLAHCRIAARVRLRASKACSTLLGDRRRDPAAGRLGVHAVRCRRARRAPRSRSAGASAGANAMNHACGRSPWAVSAVPVLPATCTPGICAAVPVPADCSRRRA